MSGLFTGPGKVLKHICSTIDEYLKYGYSLIPIDGEKKPCIYWKKFQYQKAARDLIFSWFHQFCTYNIGIVTGQISQLAVIDVDNLSVLPDLRKKLPEITRTTRVKTNRGYHYYFVYVTLKLHHPIHERIQLRIIPEKESGLSEVRFWHKDQFLGTQIVKNSDLNMVHF